MDKRIIFMGKYDFIIFGGTGQQGRICARDLLDFGYSVLLVGRDTSKIQDILKNKMSGFLSVDLRNEEEIASAIRKSQAEIVINCAELTFNVAIMRACLKTRKSCTDLGGLQKITVQQFKLHNAFKKAGIVNITGCGSTPGIANVMAAYALKYFDTVETIDLGFAWDSNIKRFVVPYSMKSIFDELTEYPIVLSNGKFTKTDRIRCMGTFDFREVGRQTAYCIVHSEVYTFAKYFKNKGLRNVHYMAGFPEHSISVIRNLIDLGFNSKDEIEFQGKKIMPLDFTINMLKNLKIPEGYKEVENLWVKIEGTKNGKKKNSEINCIIKTLPGWEEAGSNVDTGRTISIMSQMLKNKLINQSGVFAPEAVIPQKEFFNELAQRKMYVYLDGRKIN